jgi:hypothetical protein
VAGLCHAASLAARRAKRGVKPSRIDSATGLLIDPVTERSRRSGVVLGTTSELIPLHGSVYGDSLSVMPSDSEGKPTIPNQWRAIIYF